MILVPGCCFDRLYLEAHNPLRFFSLVCAAVSSGRGVGAFLGGYLIAQFGIPAAFKVFAYICIVSSVLYAIVHFCYLKKRLDAKGNNIILNSRLILHT